MPGTLALLRKRPRPVVPRSDLLAEYRLDEGSGQWVYNRAGTPTPQVNLLPDPVELELWATNATFTRNYATDPTGGDNAHRMLTAGNGYVSCGIPQTIQSYTFSVYVKSNTGSSQDFRLSLDGQSTFGTFTATTSWQRFTYTQAIASAGFRDVAIRTAATNAALDIVFYGAQVEAGAVATSYLPQRFDLHLGVTGGADNVDPTWANGGLHYSGTTQQVAGANAAAVSVTNVTLYALVRWTDGAVTPATRETAILGGPNTNLINLLGSVGASNPWPVVRHGGTTNYVEARNLKLDDGAWHILAYTYDGTTQRLWYEGYEFATQDRAIAAIALRSLYLGGRNGQTNTFPGDIAYACAYTAAHTAAQVLAATNAIKAAVAARGITVAAIDKLVVLEGDSIAAGQSYAWYALQSITPRPVSANRAIPGSRVQTTPGVSQLADPVRMASVAALFEPGRSRQILSVHAGVNDLAADGDSGVVLYGQIRDYCLAMRALIAARGVTNLKVVLGTILPTSQVGSNGVLDDRRTATNTLIRSNAVSDGAADYLADFAADATMGPLSAASNTTLYPDGTHPAPSAHQTYLAPLWKTAVEAALA